MGLPCSSDSDGSGDADPAALGGGPSRLAHDLGRPAQIVDAMPAAVVATDADGVVTEWNPAAELLCGWSAAEAVGRPARELLDVPDPVPTSTEALQSLQAGQTWHGRLPVRRKDGSALAVAVAASPLMDERGTVVGAVALMTAESAAGPFEEGVRASEQLFRSLVNRSADVALILDSHAVITYASPAVTPVFGYQPDHLEGRVGFEFVHPDDVPFAEEVLREVLATAGSHDPFELRIRAADGSYLWTEEAVTNSLDDPAIRGLILNLRDVSFRKAADAALAASEKRYRDIVESAEEGLWILDANFRTTFTNPRMSVQLQRPAVDLLGHSPAEFAHPDDVVLIEAQMHARRHGAERYEARFLAADGSTVWMLVSAHPLFDDGRFVGTHALLTDITDRKDAEDQLRHLALHDPLTGLPNRTLLTDRIEHTLARAERHHDQTGVLFVDVDNFKLINDSYGHRTGDEILLAVAERITAAVRTEDTVARFGGDEFVVVCERLYDHKEASDIAHRVLAAVREPLEIGDRPIVLTASIGIAYTSTGDAETLLRDADTAMYQAKRQGRDQTAVFDPDAHRTAQHDLALINDLRHALKHPGQLTVHYQPILGLADQQVVAAEALARWHHPEHGLVPADRFIQLAERAGLILELDRWVLDRACRQTAAWLAEGAVPQSFSVAVNVSAAHLSAPRLADTVRAALTNARLSPANLCVEVTETALMQDQAAACAALSALRAMGVCVSLDDFGTGYSSLSYLRNLPADKVKIDRSFVGGLGDGGDDEAIVASIISLADSLGLHCVAEGVETMEQLLILQSLGCHCGQGFLWSPAVPDTQLPDTLTAVPRRAIPAQRNRPRRASWTALVDPVDRQRLLHLHAQGASLQTITAALNKSNSRTPRGTRWHPATVARVVADATSGSVTS